MAGDSIVVIGAGNIGSHLVRHLARLPGLARITVVDKDRYETANLVSQDILPRDAEKPKAAVQARLLRRINPALEVRHYCDAVEDMPLGKLRGSVLLACLDSRYARQAAAESAWRLGVPLIDAGVQGEGLLARITVYLPGHDRPCLECAWSDADYAAVERVYPCGAAGNGSQPSNSPRALGGLAAALQALECRKLLAGELDRVASGREVVLNAAWHRHYVTALRRNPACRFDHRTWDIRRFACDLGKFTVRQALETGGALWLEGKPFARKLTCAACGRAVPGLRLLCSLAPPERACAVCRGRMTATAFDLVERLDGSLPAAVLDLPLGSLGLRDGDVFRAGEQHYEIACEPA